MLFYYRLLLTPLLLVLMGPLAQPAAAQDVASRATLRGTVRDAASGEVLIGATVRVPTTQQGTATALDGTFRLPDLAALKPMPDYLFFMGDMVLGHSPDTTVIGRELRAWVALYRAAPLSRTGIRMVAMPGNHEVMSGKNQPAFAGADQAWCAALRPYLAGSNGPTAGGPDQLATDQSQLSYSFDYKQRHFVILNTDPVGAEGTVPLNWLGRNLAAARARGSKHVFAFDHKPAIPAPANDGLSNGGSMWSLLDTNHAEAMLAAHNHLYYRIQTPPYRPWQLIAGNGGSPLDATASPNKLFFGFTLVKVYTSGKVMAYSYGRDLPASGYLGPTAGSVTTVRDSVDITWK